MRQKSTGAALKFDFDRRLRLRFRGSLITPNAGLPAYRELDDAVGLAALAGGVLADARTGGNDRHSTRLSPPPKPLYSARIGLD